MRLRNAVVIAVVLALVMGLGAYLALKRWADRLPTSKEQTCEARTAAGVVSLRPEQMANAATIAAVGIRRRVPERGIVVALATALQESKLLNLDYGDRDSLGLFQQRPSQGWGTPEQIRDPRYAAHRFYAALLRVPGWQNMRVTDAAQRVQRSAFPEAYEKWADEAMILAEALAGRAASAVTCVLSDEPPQRGAAAAAALHEGLRLDWGETVKVASADVVGVVVAAAGERGGWQIAHWLVAHAAHQGVERVRFGGLEWTARAGSWRRVAEIADTRTVVAEVFRP